MRISRFEKFISEKAGVSLPSIQYSDAICDFTLKEFYSFLRSGKKSESKIHEIPQEAIKQGMGTEEDFKAFPVVNIRIELIFNKNLSKEEFVDFSEGKDHMVGGAAYSFGHKNWKGYSRKAKTDMKELSYGIDLLMGLEILVPTDYQPETDRETLRDSVMEAIYHEMNHLYEFYMRLQNQKGLPLWKRSPSVSVTYSDANAWKIPRDIYNLWKEEFTYYLYLSEPHEIRAQSQEAAYHVMKYGFDKIFKTTAWKYAKEMENFRSEDFLKKLDGKIEAYTKEKGPEKTALYSGILSLPLKERLKQMWLSEYSKAVDEAKERPRIDIEKMRRKDCEYFVSHMQARINSAGERLKRNLGRLFDLADPKDNI